MNLDAHPSTPREHEVDAKARMETWTKAFLIMFLFTWAGIPPFFTLVAFLGGTVWWMWKEPQVSNGSVEGG